MAILIPSRSTRLTQPIGRSELDASHPLARYAVAAWAGQRDSVDAMGNAMRWVGPGIEQRAGLDGFEQYQTGANNSLGLWVDKSIGQFGADDFFIQARLSPGANSTSRAFLAKGDTGSTEWMFGSSEPYSALRFYGAAGAINAQDTAAGIVSGKIYTVSASRVSGIVYVYLDGKLIASDTSSTNSLSDSSHYLTIGGADYDGTTFDNTRIYVGGLSQVIVLRGIGGDDVARALYAQPWQLFRPVERRIIVDLGASGGGGTSQSVAFTLDGISAAVAQIAGRTQNASATLDGVTFAASQVAGHSQTLIATLDGISFAAVQSVGGASAQSLAITLDGVTFAAAQTLEHSQSLAASLEGVTFAASQAVSNPVKDQAVLITLDGIGFAASQTGPKPADFVELLGGGPGLPKKRKQIEKGSYLERLLSPPLVDRLERIKPEAAEVIEEVAQEAVQQLEPMPVAVQALRKDLKAEGIAYREAYREVLAQLVSEMKRVQEEEEEELTAVLAAIF